MEETVVVEEKSADCVQEVEREKEETVEEPAIIPKKGYNLDFLDKLDDLENASPTVNGKRQEEREREMPNILLLCFLVCLLFVCVMSRFSRACDEGEHVGPRENGRTERRTIVFGGQTG